MAASGVKVTGSRLVGVLHGSVDIAFDPMADADESRNDAIRQFVLTSSSGSYETTVHLAENTTTF